MTTPPVPVVVEPGNFLTAALWNSTIGATMQWAFVNGPPRFSGYLSATVNLPMVTGTPSFVSVPIDTEVYDSVGGHSTTTNPSRYTCQVPGLYTVTASVGFQANSVGNRSLRIGLNGGANANGGQVASAGMATNTLYLSNTCDIQMAVGDYIECQCWQTSTASSGLNLSSGAGTGPTLSARWVSP